MIKLFKIFLLFTALYVHAIGLSQSTITLSFIGRDSVSQNIIPLDSIVVNNPSLNCDTLLYGPVPVLSLIANWPVQVDEKTQAGSGSFVLKQNFPNPFPEITTVSVYRDYRGPLNLILFDGIGQRLAQYSAESEPGGQAFQISSTGNQILYLVVFDERNNRSMKINGTGNGRTTCNIQHLGNTKEFENSILKKQDNPGFNFYLGNLLHYTAFANGYKGKTFTDSPSADSVYFVTMSMLYTPSVSTFPAAEITQTTVQSGGNVISDGGSAVTSRGVCWSTNSMPVATGNHTTDGNGTGSFVSYVTGLTENTLYYLRAYAINSTGTGYGEEIVFTTLQSNTIPVVSTAPVTNITPSAATSGGNVSSDGGAGVTARGICWDISSNPAIAGNHSTDGTGTGSFISNLSGLSGNTLYYVRAYATNSIGTAYGDEISFTTLIPPFACGDVVAYESKNYNTVQIGTQCWFKQNLNVGIRINGIQFPVNDGISEKYCYDDLESNCDVYGGLYPWNEMMQYSVTAGSRGLCPQEWHIPTDTEQTLLVNYLGGDAIAGGKMKETGTEHWLSPNSGATNASGFTALPGGCRNCTLIFNFLTYFTSFWTSTEPGAGATHAYYRTLEYNSVTASRYLNEKTGGLSVRCIRDN